MDIQHKVLQCPELFVVSCTNMWEFEKLDTFHPRLEHCLCTAAYQTQKVVALETEQLGAWVLHDGGFRYLYAYFTCTACRRIWMGWVGARSMGWLSASLFTVWQSNLELSSVAKHTCTGKTINKQRLLAGFDCWKLYGQQRQPKFAQPDSMALPSRYRPEMTLPLGWLFQQENGLSDQYPAETTKKIPINNCLAESCYVYIFPGDTILEVWNGGEWWCWIANGAPRKNMYILTHGVEKYPLVN